jgi:hypothetical protein
VLLDLHKRSEGKPWQGHEYTLPNEIFKTILMNTITPSMPLIPIP